MEKDSLAPPRLFWICVLAARPGRGPKIFLFICQYHPVPSPYEISTFGISAFSSAVLFCKLMRQMILKVEKVHMEKIDFLLGLLFLPVKICFAAGG